MKILGIDPGLTRCGFGLIEKTGPRQVSFLDVGVLRTDAEVAIEVRIGSLARAIEELIVRHAPGAIAIERVFAQANLRSVMGTAQISGVVLNLAFQHGIPIAFHTPTEVKAAVTGSGRADKAQVGFMVAKILNLNEIPKPADAADSLAIAICHAWKSGIQVTTGSQQTVAQKQWLTAVAKANQRKG